MATITFTGLGDGHSWSDVDNWDGSVPSTDDDVIIPTGFDVDGNSMGNMNSIIVNGNSSISTIVEASTITFNDNSSNKGVSVGIVIFNNNSANIDGGVVDGTAYFYNGSSNRGMGLGSVNGDAYVRQHIADFLVWRDAASSNNVTGTLYLQFPETDILGTGLL